MTRRQVAPVCAVASFVLLVASIALFVAFKWAFSLRHFVDSEGAIQLESLLRLLALEMVFGVAALLAAIVGLVRREGLMAWFVAVLAVANLLLRAAWM